MRRKKSISKQLLKSRCPIKVANLRLELANIEQILEENYDEVIKRREEKILPSIKEDPALFYSYAKSFANISTNVGPLRDSDENIIEDDEEMSELLSNQYSSMFSTPATTINKDKLNSIFPTNETNEPINESNKPTINDINISYEKVERALKSLSNTAAPGPDGIPASCYKYGGTKMTEYLVKILRRSG